MNLLQAIKPIFKKLGQSHGRMPALEHGDATAVRSYDIEAYIAKHMAEIYVDAEALMEKYGTNFNSFFYRPNVDVFIRQEILPFKNPDDTHNHFLDYDHWMKKHPFNFPGPFYTGESVTCGTGDSNAPDNIMYDSYCCEYIFKQPQTFAEFLGVIDAAGVEAFDSYSCNGNNHWTYQKCKDWWKNKQQLLNELKTPEIRKVNGSRIQMYIDYLNGNAETDLRKYCYFLENGLYPVSDTEKLPQL